MIAQSREASPSAADSERLVKSFKGSTQGNSDLTDGTKEKLII